MSNTINRRQFFDRAAMGAAGLAAATTGRVFAQAPSDKVVVGVMGLSRGLSLAGTFSSQENVEVRYLCDVDSARAAHAVDQVSKVEGQAPRAVGDFRAILDDPEVDALVCAAPNHWHAPATILACAAGKHVYVEKPCAHNPREAELMTEAAAKHQRVVQVGTQRRSSPSFKQAIDLLHSGELGRVYSARATYASARGSIGVGKPAEVPPNLDYELWQGPAPRRPYLDNRVPYNWHWFWHWGNGELGNNGVHTLDICRWGLGVDFPVHVTSIGGRFVFDDDQETPDTQTVGFTFADEKMITWQGHSCNAYGDDFVNFYAEKGTVVMKDDGAFTVLGADNKPMQAGPANRGDNEHVANFLEAVRSGDAGLLNCGIAEAYPSTTLCHLGNIAHRTGRALHCDPANGHILNDEEAMTMWQREYEPGWDPVV